MIAVGALQLISLLLFLLIWYVTFFRLVVIMLHTPIWMHIESNLDQIRFSNLEILNTRDRNSIILCMWFNWVMSICLRFSYFLHHFCFSSGWWSSFSSMYFMGFIFKHSNNNYIFNLLHHVFKADQGWSSRWKKKNLPAIFSISFFQMASFFGIIKIWWWSAAGDR